MILPTLYTGMPLSTRTSRMVGQGFQAEVLAVGRVDKVAGSPRKGLAITRPTPWSPAKRFRAIRTIYSVSSGTTPVGRD